MIFDFPIFMEDICIQTTSTGRNNNFIDFIANNVSFNVKNNDFKELYQRKLKHKETHHNVLR